MKTRPKNILPALLSTAVLLGSCVTGTGTRTQGYQSEGEGDETEAMEFVIIKDIHIIFDDDPQTSALLDHDDVDSMLELFHSAQYDINRNDSGIMIKMTVPDYFITIEYNPDLRLDSKTAFIWRESRYIKFDNVWYTMDEAASLELFSLLESYRP